MVTAKDVVVKVIPSKIANDFVKKHHYSGKVVANSQLHFGCFLENRLHGVMSFGCSLDKRKVHSESRCISIAFKLIKKNAPHIRWIISFADGAHCGDGTIYRASGFKLTNLSTASMIELPEKYWKYNGGGKYAHRMSLQAKSSMMYKIMQKDLGLNGEYKTMEWYAEKLNTKVVEGFQLRYIYVLDKDFEISCPIIPFEKIDEMNAGMYKGEKVTRAERHNIDK